jgi:hypothetical protein
MKKRFVQSGIAGLVLTMAGLVVAGCATMGEPGVSGPPNGSYYNYYQGPIEFDSAQKTWEAKTMGYKGSFDFDQGSAAIVLNVEQELQGLQWVQVPPVPKFSSGQVNEGVVTLGEFTFRSPSRSED